MSENEKKYKCPVCHGVGIYYMEGDIHRSGGNVPCNLCDKKGYLTEAEYAKLEKERAEFNAVIKGDPPRAGIFSKKLKGG